MSIELPQQITGGSTLSVTRSVINNIISYLGFVDINVPGENKIYPYFEDFVNSNIGAYSDASVGHRRATINGWLQINHENASESGRDANIDGSFVKDKRVGTLYLNNSVSASGFVNMVFGKPDNFFGSTSNTQWVRNVDFYFRVSAGVSQGTHASSNRKLFVGLFGLDSGRAQSISIDSNANRRWIGVELDSAVGPDWVFRRDLGAAVGSEVTFNTGIANAAALASTGEEGNAFDNIVISFRDGQDVLTYINGVLIDTTPWSEVSALTSGVLAVRPIRPCVYVESTGTNLPVLLPYIDYMGVNFVTDSARPFNAVTR